MLSTTLSGQQRIDQVVAKAEQMNDVDVNVIQTKNEDTGVVIRVVKNVTISDNRSLVSEFRTAFDRERENAYQVSQNTNNGVAQIKYRFRSGDRDVSYSFRQEGDSRATVIYTNQEKGNQAFNLDFFTIPDINFTLPDFNITIPDVNSVDTAALRANMEKFEQNMEAWSREFAPQMEEWGKQMEELMKQLEPQMQELQERMKALGEEYGRKVGEQFRNQGNN